MMPMNPSRSAPRLAGAAIALSLGLALAGCGGIPTNGSVDSVHQPVVERVNYSLDITAGPGGVPVPEQRRLAGWLEAMDLRYGDTITLDDPLKSGATRAGIEALVSRYGMLVGGDAPVTPGYVNPGTVRVVISRSRAKVPGCPDWSAKTTFNPNNATSPNYGCSVNSNLASMIANPEHLLNGEKGKGETYVSGSSKAVEAYREAAPTGKSGPKSGGM